MNHPKIDLQSKDQLLAKTQNLLTQFYNEEEGKKLIQEPNVKSMIHIIARYVEVSLQRVNRMPEKNYLYFLKMLGMVPKGPKSSRVPLCFGLAEGAEHQLIPQGSQVSAEGADGEPVLFETRTNLTVIPQKLISSYSLDPNSDYYEDQSILLQEGESNPLLTLFLGQNLIPHCLYIGDRSLFQFDSSRQITLQTTLLQEAEYPLSKNLKLNWFTYDPDTLKLVPLVEHNTPKEVLHLQRSGRIHFLPTAGAIGEVELLGMEQTEAQSEKNFQAKNFWIVALLNRSYDPSTFPKIHQIEARVDCPEIEGEKRPEFPLDFSYENYSQLDLTKDFYPFGERPTFNSSWHLASNVVFRQKGTNIKLQIHLSKNLPRPVIEREKIELTWEYLDGKKWQTLTMETWGNLDFEEGDPNYFRNDPYFFEQSAVLEFTCPNIKKGDYNNEASYWIRVRLTKGGFGKAAHTTKKKNTNKDTIKYQPYIYEYIEETYTPPSIASVFVSYSPDFSLVNEIVTYNNFFYERPEKEAIGFFPYTGMSCNYPMAEILDDDFATTNIPSVSTAASGQTHSPRSFYFSYDQSPKDLPLNLFFPFESGGSVGAMPDESYIPPKLTWQYYNGKIWKNLVVADFTEELSNRDLLQFIPPEDQKPLVAFGQMLHWFRVVLTEGEFLTPPALRQIFQNTVWSDNWASQEETELDSGRGMPNQKIECPNFPVLEGAQLWVRETTLLEQEKQEVVKAEGEDAIFEIKDPSGQIEETWVRWHQVHHFIRSLAGSRHYVLNGKTGVLQCGDGSQGMIFPKGLDNITLKHYRYGGGKRGNLAKGSIEEINEALPSIDWVKNPIAAEGGIDGESAKEISIKGPKNIKIRGRVTCPEDYEWHAMEASAEVGRAKCLSNMNPYNQFTPGWVTVVVVPNRGSNKPRPTSTLIDQVKVSVGKIASANLMAKRDQITVIGPSYLKVNIKVSLAVGSVNIAKKVESQAFHDLKEFLHPIHGGVNHNGLDFGERIYKSQIYQILENIPEVDYVEDIQMTAELQSFALFPDNFTAPRNFPEYSIVEFYGGLIQMRLAKKLDRDQKITKFVALGFCEEDQLQLTAIQSSAEIKAGLAPVSMILNLERVTYHANAQHTGQNPGVRYAILHVKKHENQYSFPKGSSITTPMRDGNKQVQSYLTASIPQGMIIQYLVVALPQTGDHFEVIHKNWNTTVTTGELLDYTHYYNRIHLDANYLAYAGDINISTILSTPKAIEEDNAQSQRQYLFAKPAMELQQERAQSNYMPLNPSQIGMTDKTLLQDRGNKTIHSLFGAKYKCKVNDLLQDEINQLNSGEKAIPLIQEKGFTPCPHCKPQLPYGPSLQPTLEGKK